MKTCARNGCNNPVFSNLYCRKDQWMRKDQKYINSKRFKTRSPAKSAKIPPESKKRSKEHKSYIQLTNELWEELVIKKQNYCLFCGQEMKKKENFHHIKGRIEENYLSREFLYSAHQDCHVWDYHQADIKHLMSQVWYKGFLERLKSIDTQSYYKELKKADKAQLSLEIDDE